MDKLAKFKEPCWAHHPRGGFYTGWAGVVERGLYGQERGIAISEEAAVAREYFHHAPRSQVYKGHPPQMKTLPITFTGIDHLTRIDMAAMLPVEFGFLWSVRRSSVENRYPSEGDIKNMVKYIPRCSLHVCGKEGRQMALQGQLPFDMDYFQRMQVNGPLTDEECWAICDNYPHLTVITQLGGRGTTGNLDVKASNHAVLVDASSGNGVSPDKWQKPDVPEGKKVGYAGGLGPHNIVEELVRLEHVIEKGWWIGMEAKVRTPDDWFDLDAARLVVKQYEEFIGSQYL
jgi:phosphoribosylanthranilate isomerase